MLRSIDPARVSPGADTLPALIGPGELGIPASHEALTDWAGAHVGTVNDRLDKHGALLFRGFGFDSAEAFHAFGGAVSTEFLDYFAGATGRRQVFKDVNTSTELPAWKPLALHCELSYINRYPSRVLFYCDMPPEKGGQTPMGYMDEIWNRLDPELRERFNRDGLILQRDFKASVWPKKLGTDQRDLAEQWCAERGVELDWRRDGSVRLTHKRPATFRHPRSGKTMWFNQIHMTHPSWSWEFARAGEYVKASMYRLDETRLAIKRRFDPLACHCRFGDGTEIPRSAVNQVRRATWDCARIFDWRQGDVLVVDNLQIAHGRMPFKGRRKILALLADVVGDSDLECSPMPS